MACGCSELPISFQVKVGPLGYLRKISRLRKHQAALSRDRSAHAGVGSQNHCDPLQPRAWPCFPGDPEVQAPARLRHGLTSPQAPRAPPAYPGVTALHEGGGNGLLRLRGKN